MKSHNGSSLSQKELLEVLKSNTFRLFRDFDIDFAILVGSWSRGQQQWWSDIDLFISWPKYLKKSSKERLDSLIELNLLVEENTRLSKLELRILEKQSLHVQFSLIKEGIIFYTKNPDCRSKYLEHLFREYYDHKIWFNKLLDESLAVR